MTAPLPDGVHALPAADYFAHPALSASGAIRLGQVSPQRWRAERDLPATTSDAFDFGTAVHQLVLRDLETVEVLDFPDWRTNAAKEARERARADGLIPLLRKRYDEAMAVVRALRAHPYAFAAFVAGAPEQSLFWTDAATGIQLKARLDWLPDRGRVFADYKTAASVHPADLKKAVFTHGYHQRAAWYLDGLRRLKLAEDPAYLLIFQEKTPPYEVYPCQLDAEALGWGALQNRKAIDRYAELMAADVWPGWADDVATLSLPPWAIKQLEFDHAADAYAPAQAAE